MTVRESWTASGMTVDPVAPSELGPIRVATPYLEVERQSISSLEPTAPRELAHAHRPARRKRKSGDQPSHRVA